MNQNYFPRGGAKDKPVIQYRKFVFEKKRSTKSKKKKGPGNDSKGSAVPNFIKLPVYKPDTSHFHQSYSDLKPGFQCICAVNSIKKDGLFVNLPFGSCAMIPNSEISGPYSKLMGSKQGQKHLLNMFYSGQMLSCRIIKCETRGGKAARLCATLKPSSVNTNINSGMVKKRSLVQMAVASVEDHGYFMESGITGLTAFLPFSHATNYTKTILRSRKSLPIGTVVWTYVLKSNVNSSGANVVEVTIDPDKTCQFDCIAPSNVLWPGARVRATISKVFDDGCCQLMVDGTSIEGSVDSRLNYSGCCPDVSVGSSCQATVISRNPFTKVYSFSLCHHVGQTSIPRVTLDQHAFNVVCNAVVDNVNKKAAYLTLAGMKYKGCLTVGSSTNRREASAENGDEDESTETQWEVGSKITVIIQRLDLLSRLYVCRFHSKNNNKERENGKKGEERGESKRVDLLSEDEIKVEPETDSDSDVTIKEEDTDTDMDDQQSRTDKRHKCEDIKSESDEESDVEIKEEYDSDVSIKEEPMTDTDEDLDDKPTDVSSSLVEDISEESEPDVKPVKKAKKRKSKPDLDEKVSNGKKAKADSDLESNSAKRKSAVNDFIKRKMDAAEELSLKDVDSSFVWDATPDDLARITTRDVEEFNEESEEEKVPKKALSKKQKKVKELEKERRIREKEDELLRALDEPKSADHFERLILSRPDDSRLWVSYMAFYLEATEIEKARTVGKRALKLISHRNEQDRLNIWLALLNLEHLYGSKDLFKETWSEALKGNDDYKVNCKVLDMYASGSNNLEVNSLVQKMTKQYRERSDCWYTCLSALMTANLEDKARQLLQRALKALPPKAHVTLISRFALLENSLGHSEEGQALFDNLLSSYPARVDVWFVYLDMLTKSQQLHLVRQVFERATNQKLPAKKMKSIYKKWLEFEEKNGDEESVERVRDSAAEYVEKASRDIGL